MRLPGGILTLPTTTVIQTVTETVQDTTTVIETVTETVEGTVTTETGTQRRPDRISAWLAMAAGAWFPELLCFVVARLLGRKA